MDPNWINGESHDETTLLRVYLKARKILEPIEDDIQFNHSLLNIVSKVQQEFPHSGVEALRRTERTGSTDVSIDLLNGVWVVASEVFCQTK